ncbi:DUF349 domain-containing protein [Flagellimonas aequoris]|uniref:DUF349 domain-containing protein n=1 Tax=Flagellimonas aequoris TaxID=2306997 RepID=A0A418N610_9FLAO|nr:DUF349 domain-containing protein [Allomuricauda aequoris]RIV69822.1 DUF349 domain-containing protein [Allomuricauda aequoris]TXK01405.1 DUF349 domain-containing protein [Allomuricauda aequoris]
MQENERKLQQAEGGNEQTSDNIKAHLEESPNSEPNESQDAMPENTEEPKSETTPSEAKDTEKESKPSEQSDDSNEAIDEIDESNAEDAEDSENEKRHYIPMLDYHSMPLENLVGELQRLVKNEKVQAIGRHVSAIKYEFDQKFQEFIEQKKEEFVSKGGNEIDFRYNSVAKRQFNEVYSDYREKRDQYYKQLEQNLKNNLHNRLQIIEELKGLIDVEEDINTTYNNFKELQERWKNAGPIPRTNYNDVWRTYHHHMEIFYDFLHLNRELRDLDFKHNLEEKQKLVERAEALADEPDLGKAFRELQTLHKIWKEDIGPVDKEHREEIWERFSNATKAMHQRRQEHFQELEKVFEKNLEKKQEIIASIAHIADHVADNHRGIQKQIKEVEALRDSFFKAGKVPQKVNEETWSHFKDAVRKFNRSKNSFYKNQKKDQQQNLEKKKELLDLALSLKDSDDWATVTPEMKRIQNEWKKIGHVPRKYSDKIWNEFKEACNHYFDRLHSDKNDAHKEEYENFDKKNACLERLKEFQLSGDKKKDLEAIKEFLAEWKQYGRIPYNKKHINGKFNKIVDALLKKLGVGRHESELLKYGNKVQELAKTEDNYAIGNERVFIRRKIDESKSEIRQLENNLQFFSGDSEDNPLVKEVIKNIDKQKEALQTWKEKLKKLNILEHKLNKEAEEEDDSSEEE